MEILGERLRELRKSIGLSQAKIGALVGLPQGSINRYEHGIANPTPETLLWYADYFDVSMDYIYGRTDKPQGTTYRSIPKSNPDMVKFVEMCLDPSTNANARLKETLLKLLSEGEDTND